MDGDEFDDSDVVAGFNPIKADFNRCTSKKKTSQPIFQPPPAYQADLRTQAGHLEIPDMSADLLPRRSQEGRGAGAGFSQTSGGDQFVSSSLHQGMGREEREQLLIEFPYISPSSSQSPSLLTTPSRVREHQRTSRPTSIGLNEITPRRTSPSEQRSISFTNMETGESQMVRAVEAPSRKEPNNNNKTSKGTKTANVLKMVRSVFIEGFIISALF